MLQKYHSNKLQQINYKPKVKKVIKVIKGINKDKAKQFKQ